MEDVFALVGDYFRVQTKPPVFQLRTVGPMSLSIVSSVSIIICSKALMSTHGFIFATTLTSWLLLVTFCSLHVALRMGLFDHKPLDSSIVILFGVLNGITIGVLNLNLCVNSVGFYQMTKLAIFACTVILKALFFRKKLSRNIQLSLSVLLLGVGVATVTDLQLNAMGSVLSLLAIIATSIVQIHTSTIQKSFRVSTTQLLYQSCPYQALTLFVVGPFLNLSLTNKNVFAFEYTPQVRFFIALLCLISFSVNFNTIHLIGKTSPLTYQVTGHLETCLVLAFGHVLLQDPFSWINKLGNLIAMVGMGLYFHFCNELYQRKPTEVSATMVMASNRVKLLYKGHQILNVIFGILIGLIAVLRWCKGRAEFDRTAIQTFLVNFSMIVLVCVLPQSLIRGYFLSKKGRGVCLEAYIWTGAMVLHDYVALLMINIQYIRIVMIPGMILILIGTLGWKLRKSRTVEVGSSEKNHDGVNTMKMEDTNNEEILFVEKTNSSDKLELFEVGSSEKNHDGVNTMKMEDTNNEEILFVEKTNSSDKLELFEVGSSEKNHDGVNTMKMEDTNNEEILFVEKTNSSDKLELFEVGSSENNHDGVNTMKMEDTNNEENLFVEKTNSSDKLELFEVGSSEKNHDGVNTMKMEDTNNEEILFVEKTNSSDKLELFEVGSSEKNHDGVNTMKMEDTNNEEILFVEKTNSSDKLELFEVGSSEKNHDGVNTMKMEDTNNEEILFVEKTNSSDKLELFEVGSSEKNHDGVNTMKMEDTNNEEILFVEKTNSSDKLELFEVGSSEKNHDGVNTMKMEDTNNEEILFVEKTNSSDKLELFEVGSSEKNHDGVNTMKMEDTNNEEILFVEKTNSSDKLELFEVGSSEKNHDGVNTMKMEDTNNEEILFVEKTNSSDKLELFEVGSSEKNHDGVNTMKMEDTNNEEILFVEKTNSSDKLELFEFVSYLLQLSLVTWTQYKGQQGCTPVLSDFLLFFCSALGALGVMLASPLAGVNFRAVSKQVLPVLHKTCAVALFIAVHTLATEWLGEDMAYVCLPELITVLAWFTICVGESMSVSNFTSHRSKLIMVSSVVAILAGLISLNANDSNMQINLIMWSFRISLSSSAFSLFHVWLLHDWPGSSSESSILIRLLKVASIVGSSTAAILCAYMMVTDPMIMYEAISSFEHKAIAAVVPIILLTLIVLSAPCRPGQPEMKAKLKEAHAEVHRLKEKAEKETRNVMPSISMREPEEWGPMKALVDDEDMETSDDRQGWAWTFDDEEIVEDDMAMCNNTPRLRWTWTSKDEEIDE